MNNQNKKCDECGEPLKPSQYARLKKEGESAVKADDDLVCRNYPACKKAEKEVTKYNNLPKHIAEYTNLPKHNAEYKNQQKN